MEEFQKLLKRERARADRNNEHFSVAVFQLADGADRSYALHALVKHLDRRLRSTDVIGYFDVNSIGALLPNTAPAQAWKVIEDVREPFLGRRLFCYFVYTYPFDCMSNGGDISDGTLNRVSSCRLDNTLPLPGKIERGDEGADFPLSRANGTNGLELFLGCSIPYWKRIIDIFLASAALLLLFPLLLLIGTAIKVISPGPVLFKQQRVGYMGRCFTLWKFRSMKVNVDDSRHKDLVGSLIGNGNPMAKLDDDPQIIPYIGKFLRKSCLDELPQLFNVLHGDMSLVGPRPCLPYEFEKYSLWHKRRCDILPGMTGLWQVNGKNRLTFKEMIRLDICYEQNMSLWLDIKILLKTPFAIVDQINESLLSKRNQENEIFN